MVIGNQGVGGSWAAGGSQQVIGSHAAITEEGPGLQISTAESPLHLPTMPVGGFSLQAHHTQDDG